MDFLNIKNLHDNSLAQFKVGLVKATSFKVKNTGSAIEITDDANSVTKLKVGGSAGFTISLVGSHIVFSANSGSSPLCVSEPGRGGIPGCAYYYCHQDKYSGVSASSLTDESSPVAVMSVENLTPVCMLQSETKKDPLVTDIPNANEVPEGSLLMSSNGEWIPVNMSDLVAQITKNVVSQLNADQN